jgi:2-polyprenyl-6-methoxyphenol hydroxylase-like FAD-dependent oxidoreductase
MNEPYDAIVVGARCAGSPVAMLLARAGHRVLVVDRTALPADTVSTHYLQQYGLARLQSWGLLDEVLATGVTPITRMTISYDDAVISGFADPIDGITATLAPRRTALDPVLLGAAEKAGAEVRLGVTLRDLIVEDGVVRGVRLQTADGELVEERARIVVGADGARSRVAEAVGAGSYDVVEPACFIYYSYWTGIPDTGFHSRIGLNQQQVGLWPTNDGRTLVAVMRTRDRYADFRRDVDANFTEVLEQVVPDLAEQVAAGEQVERMTGIRYPDNFYRESAGPGWALVGDAGYHKDPFTGKGISDAFTHAELLADKIAEGLAGRPMGEALAEYTAERDAGTKGAYAFTTQISDLDLSPELQALFRAVSGNEPATRQFLSMVGGGISGEEFFAPANVGKIMGALA